jgi:hypothetical protein
MCKKSTAVLSSRIGLVKEFSPDHRMLGTCLYSGQTLFLNLIFIEKQVSLLEQQVCPDSRPLFVRLGQDGHVIRIAHWFLIG